MEKNPEACPMPFEGEDDRIREILSKARTIAVVGMSPKPERPSMEVGLYLHQAGYEVFPIHPKALQIQGLKVFPGLEALPEGAAVDLVDLFVAGERTLEAVEQAARIKAKWVWFQPGTENPAYEKRAQELGLGVVSGRCTMAEHRRLFSG